MKYFHCLFLSSVAIKHSDAIFLARLFLAYDSQNVSVYQKYAEEIEKKCQTRIIPHIKAHQKRQKKTLLDYILCHSRPIDTRATNPDNKRGRALGYRYSRARELCIASERERAHQAFKGSLTPCLPRHYDDSRHTPPRYARTNDSDSPLSLSCDPARSMNFRLAAGLCRITCVLARVYCFDMIDGTRFWF